MTPHEKKLLEFVQQRITETGIAPTYREMAEALGFRSKSGVHMRIDSLVRQGHLLRRDRAYRGIELNTSRLAGVSSDALKAELVRRQQEGLL